MESFPTKNTAKHDAPSMGTVEASHPPETAEVAPMQELDLSDPAHFQLFIESVEDVYAEAAQFAAVAAADNYAKLRFETLTGEAVFRKMTAVLSKVRRLADEYGRQLETGDDRVLNNLIDEIQTLYNTLVELRNHFQSHYTRESTAAAEVSEPVVEVLDDGSAAKTLPPEPVPGLVPEVAVAPETDFFATQPRRRTMQITSDNTDGEVVIDVTEHAREIGAKTIPEKITFTPQLITNKTTSRFTRSAFARAEKRDPINVSVPVGLPEIETVPFSPKVVHNELPRMERSTAFSGHEFLAKPYLKNARYQTYLQENFKSVAEFERKLAAKLTQIESQATDRLEKWLGESSYSAFSYLEDKKISELISLAEQDDLRDILRQENVKYEAFLLWIDRLPEMHELVRVSPTATFGELCTKWVIESDLVS